MVRRTVRTIGPAPMPEGRGATTGDVFVHVLIEDLNASGGRGWVAAWTALTQPKGQQRKKESTVVPLAKDSRAHADVGGALGDGSLKI